MKTIPFLNGVFGELLALLLAVGSAGEVLWAQGVRIDHIPPNKGIKGEPIVVRAEVVNSPFLPRSARLYFREERSSSYAYLEMRIERYRLIGEIPGEVTRSGGFVEYYLWVELEVGGEITSPEGLPFGGEPWRVELLSPYESSTVGHLGVTILHPDPGTTIPEGPVVIAVSINLTDEEQERFRFRIFVDGGDLTSQATFSSGVVVLHLAKMRQGIHTVHLYRTVEGREEELVRWQFRVLREGMPPLGLGPVRGEVVAGISYEEISQSVRNPEFVDARFSGSWKNWEWAARGYVSSLEKPDQQPVNRYLGTLKWKKFKLTVGDAQPQFSEFTLWGVRTRGYELNFRSFSFNLDVAQGEIRRAIEGRSIIDSVVVIDPDTRDTLKSQIDPLKDSIRVESRLIPGTYHRNLLAVRPGFPLSDNLTLSFTALKVKDDISSIELGRSPQDNLVIGTDLTYTAFRRRLQFTTETAVSLFNRDISRGAMEDAQAVKSLIVINQFFEPFPSDSSILEEDKDPLDLAKTLGSEILKSSTAHRTTLTLNFFRNELRLGYKSIGRSFRSVGSPTVLTDVRGFSLQDRLRLLRNRVYLTLGYENYQNNVNGRDPYTTKRQIVRTGIAYYPMPPFPSFNFTFSNYGRSNNGELLTSIAGTDTLIQDTRVKSDQGSWTLGIEKPFQLGGWSHITILNFTHSQTQDHISPSSNSGAQGVSLSLNSLLSGVVEISGSFNWQEQKYRKDLNHISYYNMGLGGRYFLLPHRLTIQGGINTTIATGREEDVMPQPPDKTKWGSAVQERKIAFNRFTFSGGMEFLPHPRHTLNLSLMKTLFTDQGFTRYWDQTEKKNREQPGFIDQDDISLRLTYQYRL